MELAAGVPEPKKHPFNPAWIAVGVLSLTQIMGWGAFGQRATTTESQVVDLMAWRTVTDKRLSETEKSVAVSNAETRKDFEQVKAGIQALQSALMVRQPSVSLSNP